MNKTIKLAICIALPLIIGGISGFFTSSNIPGWYALLNKPSFNPPNYLFGPVWSLLYALMGIALYLVIQTKHDGSKQKAYTFWAIQMALNFAWSLIFFHFKRVDIALIEIVPLWISIFMTIYTFSKINKTASYLLVPYIAWVSFATLLNAAIFNLN